MEPILRIFELLKFPKSPKLVEYCKIVKFWISFGFCLVGRGSKNQPKFCFLKESVPELAIALDVTLFS